MPYKPKFCCQCGEKIERLDWKPWTSRRFCELCATEFGIHDWTSRIAAGIFALIGLYGIGSVLRQPEKPLNVAQTQFIAPTSKPEATQTPDAQVLPSNRVQPSAQPNNLNSAVSLPPAQLATNLKSKPATAQQSPDGVAEKVYFCGAPTKKGTMCSRRVKNGGRCWQHQGQVALLPQEKLLAAAQ